MGFEVPDALIYTTMRRLRGARFRGHFGDIGDLPPIDFTIIYRR